jgi:hypothetical protein
MAAGLKAHGLSREAVEDPEILLKRIAGIAEKVRKSLGKPAEHVFPSLAGHSATSGPPGRYRSPFANPSTPRLTSWNPRFSRSSATPANGLKAALAAARVRESR